MNTEIEKLGNELFGAERVKQALTVARGRFKLSADDAHGLVEIVIECIANTPFTTVDETMDRVCESAESRGRLALDQFDFVSEIAAALGFTGQVDLVGLHRTIARNSRGYPPAVMTTAADVVASLARMSTAAERALPGAPQLDTKAVQQAVDHVCSALGMIRDVRKEPQAMAELATAQMWRDQVRMTTEF